MKIRELPLEFRKSGILYRQLDKKVYNKTDKDGKDRVSGYVIYSCKHDDGYFCYEVFEYKLQNPHPMDTVGWDKVEAYPNNESFGSWAWSCPNKDSLRKVMNLHFGIEYDDKIFKREI